jgi:hypothetical protein
MRKDANKKQKEVPILKILISILLLNAFQMKKVKRYPSPSLG